MAPDNMATKINLSSSGRLHGVPRILYGTAFKEGRDAELVEEALKQGFVGIDTASHLRAYSEKDTGRGIRAALSNKSITRKDIFIQTKFSPFKHGKAPEFFPYDTTADLETQVRESVASSLRNLDTSSVDGTSAYLDSLIIHEPCETVEETVALWRILETYVPHQIASLGLSNTSADTLRVVYEAAAVKPAVVQNRFTHSTNQNVPMSTPLDPYDISVRRFCAAHGILYQPWGTVWGNPELLESEQVANLSERLGVERMVALLFCVLSLGKVNGLCGTKTKNTMGQVLTGLQKFDDWRSLEANRDEWDAIMTGIRAVTDGTA